MRGAERFDVHTLPDEGPVDLDVLTPGKGELELDLGFGKGTFLLDRACAAPDRRVMGIEVRAKYVALVEERILKLDLKNAYVFRADARSALSRAGPDGALSRVFIHFPDPWWKKRHHKRRLLDEPIVGEIARLLRPGGELFVQTDVEERAVAFEGILGACLALEGGRVNASPSETPSPRERRCLADGIPVHRLLYRRVADSLERRRRPR